MKCLFKSFAHFLVGNGLLKKFCSVLWLYSPYGTFTRGCTNKLNFFPSIVNAGHAVMGHKAALKKNPACHFLLMHLFLVPFSMSICLECFCLVFHQGQENLINSERWRKEDKNRARMPQGQLQVKDVFKEMQWDYKSDDYWEIKKAWWVNIKIKLNSWFRRD